MNDDFNTPVAVSVLFDLAGEVNRTRDARSRASSRELAGVLGLLGREPRVPAAGERHVLGNTTSRRRRSRSEDRRTHRREAGEELCRADRFAPSCSKPVLRLKTNRVSRPNGAALERGLRTL